MSEPTDNSGAIPDEAAKVTVLSTPEAADGERSSGTAAGARGRASQLPLAMLTLLAGGLLAAGNDLGSAALIAAVGVLQAVLIGAWVFGTGLPGRIGALLMGVAASAAADLLVLRYHQHGYQPILGVLGVAIPVMFIHQLTRGVVRSRVVESLADITVLLLAVTAVAGLVLLRYEGNGQREVLTVVAAMTAGLLVDHLTDLVAPAPRFDPQVDRGLPGVVLGIAAGAAMGMLLLRHDLDFGGGRAAFAGGAIAAVASLLSIGASFAGVHSTLAAATPDSQPDMSEAGRRECLPGADPDAESRPDALLADVPAANGVASLRPFAAVLVTAALTTPAGYVLMVALSS